MSKLGIENSGSFRNLPERAQSHMIEFLRIYNQLPKNEKEKLINEFNSNTTSQLNIDKSLQSTIILIIPVLDTNGIKILSLERDNGNLFLPTVPNFAGHQIEENIKHLENKMFIEFNFDFNIINDAILNKENRSFIYYCSKLLDINEFNNLILNNEYDIYKLKLIDQQELPKLHQEVSEKIFNHLFSTKNYPKKFKI